MSCNNSPLEKLIFLEKKYADFGFDWPHTQSILKQALSEIKEVEAAIKNHEGETRIQEEMGDLLHAVLSLIRFNGYDAQEILEKINLKFESRCEAMKDIAAAQNIYSFKGLDFDEMLKFWDKAKEKYSP
jgi:ATP diphosphatase